MRGDGGPARDRRQPHHSPGLSFGSFWATQMAAAERPFTACTAMYTCFQLQNWPLHELTPSSLKLRFMYMTGIDDKAGFGPIMAKMYVITLSPHVRMPYFVMAGEDGSLSDFGCTIEHMNHVSGSKTLMVFEGEEHDMGGSRPHSSAVRSSR